MENGHDVFLYDATFKENHESLKKEVLKADMVAFTSTSKLFPAAKKILEVVKPQNPGIPYIIGGPHGTARPAEVIQAGFDYVVLGEGEQVILNLINALYKKETHTVDGVALIYEGQVKITPPKTFISNLDTIPFPARNLWDYHRYFEFGLDEISILATRGCPANCLYCKPMVNKLFGQKVRKRSARNVVDEIETLCIGYRRYFNKKPRFWFHDDTLTVCGKDWFVEFGVLLKERGIEIDWGCESRVDTVDFEMLRVMKSSGLWIISFGVESGSQKVLDFYRKGTTPEKTIKAFDAAHKLDIETYAYVMAGAPVETRQDLELTIRLIERINPDGIDIYTTTPAPGTDLYQYAIDEQLIRSYDINFWAKSSPLKLQYLSDDDIAWFRKSVYEIKNSLEFYRSYHIIPKGKID